MNETSAALAALLRRDVLGEAVPVSFDAPNRPWTQTLKGPTVNAFLFDVRENLARRDVMLEPVRDAHGVVVGRRPPPTRYDLHYVLSVWCCPTAVEYQVLSALVSTLDAYDVLPGSCFQDPPPEGHGYFLTVGAGMKRGMLPMFAGELKLQLDLTVSVPWQPPVAVASGPPVREGARIRVASSSPDEIATVRGARLPAPRDAVTDPFAATRAALSEAVAALPPPPPPAPAGAPGGRPGGPGQPPGGRPGAAAPARPGGAPGGPPGRPAGAAPGGPQQAPPRQAAAPVSPLVALRSALAQAA